MKHMILLTLTPRAVVVGGFNPFGFVPAGLARILETSRTVIMLISFKYTQFGRVGET